MAKSSDNTDLDFNERRLQKLFSSSDVLDMNLSQQLRFILQLTNLPPDVSQSTCDVIRGGD